MPMTQDDRHRAAEALQAHLTGPCPVCHQRQFRIADLVHVSPNELASEVEDSGFTVPLVLVVCNKCGYVLPFSATHLGVWEPADT